MSKVFRIIVRFMLKERLKAKCVLLSLRCALPCSVYGELQWYNWNPHRATSAITRAMNPTEEESTPLMIRGRGGSQTSSSSTGGSLQVHLYYVPATKKATTIHISSGQISAESVCLQAGKKSGKRRSSLVSQAPRLSPDSVNLCPGILPVYIGLFGLASADLSFWYPPSHIFNTDEKLQVCFRVRWVRNSRAQPKTPFLIRRLRLSGFSLEAGLIKVPEQPAATV